MSDKVQKLLKWASDNDIAEDPDRMGRLHDEARRRWPKLISRHISEIIEETLRKME